MTSGTVGVLSMIVGSGKCRAIATAASGPFSSSHVRTIRTGRARTTSRKGLRPRPNLVVGSSSASPNLHMTSTGCAAASWESRRVADSLSFGSRLDSAAAAMRIASRWSILINSPRSSSQAWASPAALKIQFEDLDHPCPDRNSLPGNAPSPRDLRLDVLSTAPPKRPAPRLGLHCVHRGKNALRPPDSGAQAVQACRIVRHVGRIG